MKQIGSILSDRIQKLARERENRSGQHNGEPLTGTSETYSCALCQDRGIVLKGDTARPCVCMRQKALARRFKNAHLSQDMLHYSLNRFQLKYYTDKKDSVTGGTYREMASQAFKAATEFVREAAEQVHGDGLLFTGPVGCGKTFLAGGIANALMEAGREVLFIVVPDLLDEIKATYDPNRNNSELTEQHLMDKARSVEVLILDDLGAHNYTDWTRNRLYSIINYRLNNALRTVVTTNLSPQELEEYIGERSTSRLFQMCRIRRLNVVTDIRYCIHAEKQKPTI